ncbi:MAG TPA: MBL fold metallo-hydrolase [Polyangia bacterium]
MKTFFKVLKVLGLLVGALVLSVAVLLFITFSGGLPIQDGQRLDGVEVVKDGFVSAFIVDIDDHDVALIDAGKDKQATAILAALARRKLGPDAVKAILLTHGDADHTAGVALFPQAKVMALEPEIGLVEGREARGIFKLLGVHPNGIKVTRALHDGDSLTLGPQVVRVFAVPGHTKGSAAFLVRGVLFMGDTAEATKDSRLAAGRWLSTENPAQDRASLHHLARQMEPWAGQVKAIACSHTGLLTLGLAPLTEFAASDK